MASTYWDTLQIKKGHGIGDVTEDEKNARIERAVNTWDQMKMTDEQKAFGLATMRQESGFDPKAKGSSKTEYEVSYDECRRIL